MDEVQAVDEVQAEDDAINEVQIGVAGLAGSRSGLAGPSKCAELKVPAWHGFGSGWNTRHSVVPRTLGPWCTLPTEICILFGIGRYVQKNVETASRNLREVKKSQDKQRIVSRELVNERSIHKQYCAAAVAYRKQLSGELQMQSAPDQEVPAPSRKKMPLRIDTSPEGPSPLTGHQTLGMDAALQHQPFSCFNSSYPDAT